MEVSANISGCLDNSIGISRLDELILLTVLEEPRYGKEMIDMISLVTDGVYQVNYGSLYPALKKLERASFLETYACSNDLNIRGGHRRKYYRITSLGKIVLLKSEQPRQRLKNWIQYSSNLAY